MYERPHCCHECRDRISRREHWKGCSHVVDREDAAEAIGVGRLFCRGGDWPSLDDEKLREWIGKHPLPEGGIFVCGPVGSHKSHLLAARTIDAARRGFSARYLNWWMFALETRDTYHRLSRETERDVLNRYATVEFLALDDLGVGSERLDGKESEAARVLTYGLLNLRYDRRLVTDISSNKTPAELEERFDDRIRRRLENLCAIYPILIKE